MTIRNQMHYVYYKALQDALSADKMKFDKLIPCDGCNSSIKDSSPNSQTTRSTPTELCLKCGMKLCKSCAADHILISKEHELQHSSSLTQRARKKSTGLPEGYCFVHPGKMLTYFCRTCHHAVCNKCHSLEHVDHDCSAIQKIAQEFRDKVCLFFRPFASFGAITGNSPF